MFIDCYVYQDFFPEFAEASKEFPVNTYGPLSKEDAERVAEYLAPYFSKVEIVAASVGQAIQPVPGNLLAKLG